MLGTVGMESCDSKSWVHSRWGFELLEDKYYVGDLYEPSRDQEWHVRLSGSNTAGFSNENWDLRNVDKLSNTTNRYEFQNSKFTIKLDIPSTLWIGRHFIISRGDSKSRLYTNCTMLDSSVIAWRNNLIKSFENQVENTQHAL
jgi:hypothetical protein